MLVKGKDITGATKWTHDVTGKIANARRIALESKDKHGYINLGGTLGGFSYSFLRDNSNFR